PEEYQLMKKHSTEGAKIFSNLMKKYPNNSLIRICHEVTRWHHERWDGTGYPDGLKGTAIPLTARIVAIADVFDALTTRRSYRNEFTSEEAIKIMTDDENGHFDSHLLEILLKHKKLFTSIAQSRLAAQLDEVRK
ncbi:MAG: HD domain-containing protein, partial [Fervidobacterium sp.]|nr:HD domain-containing protein [Fervidobacterium sp.]